MTSTVCAHGTLEKRLLALRLARMVSCGILFLIKDKNLETLSAIIEHIPNFENVIIPQIYAPDEYDQVVATGIERIIWKTSNLYVNLEDIRCN